MFTNYCWMYCGRPQETHCVFMAFISELVLTVDKYWFFYPRSLHTPNTTVNWGTNTDITPSFQRQNLRLNTFKHVYPCRLRVTMYNSQYI